MPKASIAVTNHALAVLPMYYTSNHVLMLFAGMTLDDVREFEHKLHEETNQKVLEGMEAPDSGPGT